MNMLSLVVLCFSFSLFAIQSGFGMSQECMDKAMKVCGEGKIDNKEDAQVKACEMCIDKEILSTCEKENSEPSLNHRERRHNPNHRRGDGMDHDQWQNNEFQTGSESGIEVVENEEDGMVDDSEDPWDSIMERIKAISNSTLPSEVKIQCV